MVPTLLVGGEARFVPTPLGEGEVLLVPTPAAARGDAFLMLLLSPFPTKRPPMRATAAAPTPRAMRLADGADEADDCAKRDGGFSDVC